MSLEIDLRQELPDLARAMALMRNDAVIEERMRRVVPVVARVAFGVPLVFWMGAYLVFPVVLGGYGWAFIACVAAANVVRIVQLGHFVPPDAPNKLPSGIVEILQFIGGMAFFFPTVAILGLRTLDSRVKRPSAKLERVREIRADPRWQDMRRLWAALELYNLTVATRDNFDLMALIAEWGVLCKPEMLALVRALAGHAAIAAPLLLDARTLMHCRPFGHSGNAPTADFSRRVADLDLATGAVVTARARFLDRIRDLSDDGAA